MPTADEIGDEEKLLKDGDNDDPQDDSSADSSPDPYEDTTNPRNRRRYVRELLRAKEDLPAPLPSHKVLLFDDSSLEFPHSLTQTHRLAVSLFGPTAIERHSPKHESRRVSNRIWSEPKFAAIARKQQAQYEALRDGHFTVFSTQTELSRLNVKQIPELRALIHSCKTVTSKEALLKVLGDSYAALNSNRQRAAALRLMLVQFVRQRHFDQGADVLEACMKGDGTTLVQNAPEISFRELAAFFDAEYMLLRDVGSPKWVCSSARSRVFRCIEEFVSVKQRRLRATLCDDVASCDAPAIAMLGLCCVPWREVLDAAKRIRQWDLKLKMVAGGQRQPSSKLSAAGWSALVTAAHRGGATIQQIRSKIVDIATQEDEANFRNILLWNAYIDAIDEDWQHALELFEKNLPHYEMQPNAGTFAALIRCFLRCGKVDEAMRMYRAMRARSVVMTMNSTVAMFEVLAASGQRELAEKEFKTLANELQLGTFMPPKNKLPHAVRRAARIAVEAVSHSSASPDCLAVQSVEGAVEVLPDSLFF